MNLSPRITFALALGSGLATASAAAEAAPAESAPAESTAAVELDPRTGAAISDPAASGMVIDPSTGAWVDPDALGIVEPAPRVLFGGNERELGGWGGLATGVTSINESPAQIVGFSGGLLLNHRFTLGLAGWGIASWVEADEQLFKSTAGVDDRHFIEGGWGGLLLSYEPWAFSVVHPVVSATLGIGAVTYSQRQYEDGWDDAWDVGGEIYTADARPVGVFSSSELSVGGTVNVARWCRLDATVGYRWVGGLDDFEGLDDGEMGGATAGLGLRFGRF